MLNGDRVELRGLHKAELNGYLAKVKKFVSKTEQNGLARYAVEVDFDSAVNIAVRRHKETARPCSPLYATVRGSYEGKQQFSVKGCNLMYTTVYQWQRRRPDLNPGLMTVIGWGACITETDL